MNKTKTNELNGQRAPAPGQYTGKVDSYTAIFWVSSGEDRGVTAWWIEFRSDNQPFTASDAWDVADGRFIPRRKGRPVRCSFRKVQP